MAELRVIEGGASNSRPTPGIWSQGGIDTVRYRFRGDVAAYERFAMSGPHNEGPRGELYRQEDGVRIGAHRSGMLYAEGRLAALLEGSDDHSLRPPSQLQAGADAAARRFAFHVEPEGAAIGRIDIAGELRFDNGSEGRVFLHALSLADVPWAKVGTEGKKRENIETVNFRSVRGRQILMRAYDKGVEAKIAPPGEVIRLERQRRYRRSQEIPVDDVILLDMGALFAGRELRSLLRVTAEVVCDKWGAIDRINQLVMQGRLRATRGDSLAGFVARGGEGHKLSTWYSRWADLRELGIVIDPLARERTAVLVGARLREVAEQLAA